MGFYYSEWISAAEDTNSSAIVDSTCAAMGIDLSEGRLVVRVAKYSTIDFVKTDSKIARTVRTSEITKIILVWIF